MVHSIILASIGGFLAALSTSIHLFLKGRVTGFSGILYSIWSREEGSNTFRYALFIGLLTIGSFMKIIDSNNYLFFESNELVGKNFSSICMMLSGFLVGFGTKLGNGCTSGHAICGMPRFSLRSYVATGLFLGFGIITATLRYYFPFLLGDNAFSRLSVKSYEEPNFIYDKYHWITLIFLIVTYCLIILYLFIYEYPKAKSREFSDSLVGFLVGIIFGFALTISGMTKRSKIINFLSIGKNWDPSPIFIMGVATISNAISFHFILNMKRKPIFSDNTLTLKPSSLIDLNLIIGHSLFGIGWGLSGLCPGPAITSLSVHFFIMFPYIMYVLIGQACGSFYVKSKDFIKLYIKEKEDLNKNNLEKNKKISETKESKISEYKSNLSSNIVIIDNTKNTKDLDVTEVNNLPISINTTNRNASSQSDLIINVNNFISNNFSSPNPKDIKNKINVPSQVLKIKDNMSKF